MVGEKGINNNFVSICLKILQWSGKDDYKFFALLHIEKWIISFSLHLFGLSDLLDQ